MSESRARAGELIILSRQSSAGGGEGQGQGDQRRQDTQIQIIVPLLQEEYQNISKCDILNIRETLKNTYDKNICYLLSK